MTTLEQYIPFWKEITEKEREMLKATVLELHIKKGETVFNTSMDCLGVMVLKNGQLRAYMVSEEGKELTLYRLLEHDMCLFSASCVMRNIEFEIQITAKEETDVLLIPIPAYEKLMQTSIPVLQYMNQLMAARFSDVMWVMDQMLNQNMDSRLGAFLLQSASLAGTNELHVTHEELAGELGTAREVITRMLKYLQAEGMVRVSRGHITIIDTDRLFQLAQKSIR